MARSRSNLTPRKMIRVAAIRGGVDICEDAGRAAASIGERACCGGNSVAALVSAEIAQDRGV